MPESIPFCFFVRLDSEVKKRHEILTLITGSESGASTEHQTVNLVLASSVVFVLWGICLNIGLGLVEPNYVLIPALFLLGYRYYRSRLLHKYRWNWIPLSLLGYFGLFSTFFLNAGSDGPVLLVSIPILIGLMAVVRPKWYPVFISLHFLLFIGLGALELTNPDVIVSTYANEQERIIDNTLSYIISVAFFSVILSFIRYSLKKQEKELQKQREQLKDQNNQLKSIFSVLSHDLRGPLANVRGYLDYMYHVDLDENQRKELERDLSDSTNTAASILEDLLVWAKAQIQGQESERTRVQLSALFDRAVADVRDYAKRKEIFIEVESKQLNLECNKEQMSIVLRNLLHNAIKYSPKGSTVKMLADQKGNKQTTIQIIDSGVGMSQEDLKRLFERVAYGRSGTDGEKGAGIGLLLTGQLVKQNGGAIHVESVEGEGSVFSVSFN